MSAYRIENNRLCIADELKGRFTVAHDEFGSGIAYSSDTLIVFYDEQETQTFAINPPAFRWLIGAFFILNGFLYHGPFKLGRVDSESLRGCTERYVWDQTHVYYINGPVLEANPICFQDLGNFWSRDDERCFFQARQVSGADAPSFRVIDHTFAADRNRIYGFGGRVIVENAADPVHLGNNYYSIAGDVFFGSTKIPDADLQTFRALPVFSPEDKRRIWADGGPKDELESLAISGFTAYDSRYKYRGPSRAPERKRPAT
jgi:hypothetical protein